MPFQLTNDANQVQVENFCNAKLVTFLEWQLFENVMVENAFPVITNEFEGVIQYFRWGLVPVWAKTPMLGKNMAKTKKENLLEKDALKAIYQYKRCVVPVTKFVVWANKEKTAVIEYTDPNKQILLLAGLWSVWGEGLNTFSILTQVKKIKDVEVDWPIFLTAENKTQWLSKKTMQINNFERFCL